MKENNLQFKLEDVYKIYNVEKQPFFALSKINLSISKGTFNVIVGSSGSGKTTLLKIMSGILKPTKGLVEYDNVNISELSDYQLAEIKLKNFGLIFQEFNLVEHLTAFENIQFPNYDTNDKKTKELLTYFKIDNCKNKFPSKLSLGEKQRILTARAIYSNPGIVFADEPTANLDWQNAINLIEFYKEYTKKGNTIILTTHDERILDYATNIIKLKDGEIFEN